MDDNYTATRYKIEYYQTSIIEENILLVTHSSSILCFLESIIPTQMAKYRKEHNVDSFKFKNSSVIKLEINNNGCIKITLVHDGGSKILKKKYFTNNPHPVDNSIYFEPVFLTFLDVNIFLFDLNGKNYNIFITRHSQSAHNIDKNNKLQDTLLTLDGVEEAHIIGCELSKLLNNKKMNYLFCSNLRRTRQTIDIILNHINTTAEEIIVLPCMHDLKAKLKGVCKAKIPNLITIAGKMICNIHSDTCTKNDLCCYTNKKKIYWKYYKSKYNSMDCITKNIIQLVLDYINQIN